MAESSSPEQRARNMWHAVDAGVLASQSVTVAGYPLGSVTPFVTTPSGCPVILVSGIAQHTRNMKADPRVCLTVLESTTGDKQTKGRVSLLGDAAPVSEQDLHGVERRYFAFFPSSRGHFQAHDFGFWAIQPRRVRYIAGFGDIHWIEPEAWAGAAAEWAAGEEGILDHMNRDHADALAAICQVPGEASEGIQMLALSPYGFHVRTPAGVRYQPFDVRCGTSEEVRAEVVRMTQAARARG